MKYVGLVSVFFVMGVLKGVKVWIWSLWSAKHVQSESDRNLGIPVCFSVCVMTTSGRIDSLLWMLVS